MSEDTFDEQTSGSEADVAEQKTPAFEDEDVEPAQPGESAYDVEDPDAEDDSADGESGGPREAYGKLAEPVDPGDDESAEPDED
jgi:hypothetical protein